MFESTDICVHGNAHFGGKTRDFIPTRIGHVTLFLYLKRLFTLKYVYISRFLTFEDFVLVCTILENMSTADVKAVLEYMYFDFTQTAYFKYLYC